MGVEPNHAEWTILDARNRAHARIAITRKDDWQATSLAHLSDSVADLPVDVDNGVKSLAFALTLADVDHVGGAEGAVSACLEQHGWTAANGDVFQTHVKWDVNQSNLI